MEKTQSKETHQQTTREFDYLIFRVYPSVHGRFFFVDSKPSTQGSTIANRERAKNISVVLYFLFSYYHFLFKLKIFRGFDVRSCAQRPLIY